jgi:hypothetical protein
MLNEDNDTKNDGVNNNLTPKNQGAIQNIPESWNVDIENVLLDIMKSCTKYKNMNIFTARRITLRYDILMYILICIGPLAGVLSTINDSIDNKTLKIIIIVVSFINGIFASVVKYSKFEQNSVLHKSVGAKYMSLETNIKTQLSIDKHNRVNAKEYMDYILKSYEELYNNTPLIPDDIFKEWLAFRDKNADSTNEEKGGKDKKYKNADSTNEEKNEEKDTVINIPEERARTHSLKENSQKKYATELNQYGDSKMRYEMRRFNEHVKGYK